MQSSARRDMGGGKRGARSGYGKAAGRHPGRRRDGALVGGRTADDPDAAALLSQQPLRHRGGGGAAEAGRDPAAGGPSLGVFLV